jgi:hypothetical protein
MMDSICSLISLIIESKIVLLLSLIIILIGYIKYKLTFWKRQGIPNDVFHTYKSFKNVMQINDWNCIKTNGKVVG